MAVVATRTSLWAARVAGRCWRVRGSLSVMPAIQMRVARTRRGSGRLVGVVFADGLVDHGGELVEGYAEPVELYYGSPGIDGGRWV